MSDRSEKKILLFAHQDVGYSTLEFILSDFKNSLAGIITVGESDLKDLASASNLPHFDFNTYRKGWSIESLPEVDYIILAWWPKIIGKEIIDFPKIGAINFHPSYLPFNRGKNYNFWTIVEKCKFGVSLHFVDEGIDSGDVIFQKEISKSWEDTGETLYVKAKSEMLALFKESYAKILNGEYVRIKQEKDAGSFHYEKELDKASILELDKTVKTEDILNLLRARTFPGKPSCSFIENDIKYEVRISIKIENN
jgi:methionyl-tRNA formyltransferase